MASDLAQMANGAASAFGDIRQEMRAILTSRTERKLNEADLATREELDAALTRIEALAQRIALLEAQLAAADSQAKSATAKKQPRAKKAPAKKS